MPNVPVRQIPVTRSARSVATTRLDAIALTQVQMRESTVDQMVIGDPFVAIGVCVPHRVGWHHHVCVR